MPLRLFADECVDARVVAGLRRRGVDIITAADECLLHASDEEQFARATHLGRPIVTADQDTRGSTARRPTCALSRKSS